MSGGPESLHLLEDGESRGKVAATERDALLPANGLTGVANPTPSWRRPGFLALALVVLSGLAFLASSSTSGKTATNPLALAETDSSASPTGWFSTKAPTARPSSSPTLAPTPGPTVPPTWSPTALPTLLPSASPSYAPSARPSNPTAQPTPTPAPSLAQTTCSALGPYAYAGYTLVDSSASGIVYAGIYGYNPDASMQGRKDSYNILLATVYYSKDGGSTISTLSEASACSSLTSGYYGQTFSLAGLSAAEDSSYSYVWYACNPYLKYDLSLSASVGYFTASVCRVPLSGQGANSCLTFTQAMKTAFPTGFLFTNIKRVTSSGDGSVAAVVGTERGLVICSKDAAFTTVTCTQKSIARYASVAFDSTGTTILAAPVTGLAVRTGLVADDPDATYPSKWTSTPSLPNTKGKAASWTSCVASDSFKVLACAQNGGYVYVSRDSGSSWTASSKYSFYYNLAMTSSGSSFAASPSLSVSANGLDWTAQTACSPSTSIYSVALSSSGSVYYTPSINTIYENSKGIWQYDSKKSLYKTAATYTGTDGSSTDSAADGTADDTTADDATDDTNTDNDWTWESMDSSVAASYASACVSSDGMVIAAVVSDGTLKVSTDAGQSWAGDSTAGNSVDWSDIIASSDGSTIVAVSYDGAIYRSTDSGSIFLQADAPTDTYLSVKCSSDGTTVLTGGFNDVYLSTDSGASFASVGMTALVSSSDTAGYNVAMSSDASYLFAASTTGGIFASTDMGASWSETYKSDGTFWSSIASNSDASVLLASSTTSYVYASYDRGATFTALNDTGTNPYTWSYVDISADGQVMVAGSRQSYVWVSVDAGASWSATGDVDMWTSVSLTSDGGTIVGSSQSSTSMVKATYTPSSDVKASKKSEKSKRNKSKSKKSKGKL